MNQPATRDEALEQLQNFVAVSGRYSRDRNHVIPGHGNVSCLSAAIRHRLITEWEVAVAPLTRYAASTVEKFTQEVYWRTYWKGWLSLRPQVWTDYLEGIKEHPDAEAIRRGEGPIEAMNNFARELTQTGYLHNHARMWFSAYWVHVARLPWQLGARFFQDHLLDFDPASNTLSWRWVAGLQTPGKTYLPRRGNLEKYLHPDLLPSKGLELLENPSACLPRDLEKPPITRNDLPENVLPQGNPVLWIHGDDLSPESSLLGKLKPSRIVVTSDLAGKSALQTEWLGRALDDAAQRAEAHFGVSAERAESLLTWTRESGVPKVVALRPEIGPLHDLLPSIEAAGITVEMITRPEDRYLRAFAAAGFFGFWKKLQKKMADGDFPLDGNGMLF